MPRDRSDYAAAIGDSWKQQTLLNIVRLRYGDYPKFMEIGQVIAGYQLQTTAAAGIGIANYTSAATGVVPAAVGGTAAVGATFIDRPTIIYAPLTGTDFVRKLMEPMPPSAVLFLLQSCYSATVVMPLTLESINGVVNESRRPGMSRSVDPQFVRLAWLLDELQQANALQIRIDREKGWRDDRYRIPARRRFSRCGSEERRGAQHPPYYTTGERLCGALWWLFGQARRDSPDYPFDASRPGAQCPARQRHNPRAYRSRPA